MVDHEVSEGCQDTLGCFDRAGTPMTTTEVANCLDIGRRSSYDRLAQLVDQGVLETKQVGASARVWWRPAQPGGDRSGAELDWATACESILTDVLDDAAVGMFVLDETFDVVWSNETAERYFGVSRQQLRDTDKRRLIEESIAPMFDDPAAFADTVLETYDDNTYTERFECYVTPGPAREGRWLEHRSKPIDAGPFAGGRVELYYDITERKESEQAARRQREQLAALNDLHTVVREITDVIIRQSTREQIERTVCERLAASESYLFAWIGDVDMAGETVTLRTEAGVEGYLDGTTITIDPDDETSERATSSAIRTGEIRTTADTDSDCCRGRSEQYGCHSSEAIPIVHEGTRYGVLNVYSERPDAFACWEQRVINKLGEIVGHAIAATERKQALMSDDIVELQFLVPDEFETAGGRITFDHAVTVGDGVVLVYGTATAEAVDSMHALVERRAHWQAVSFTERIEASSFELRLSEPPVLSAVASVGGSIKHATIEDGDYRLTVHVPPGTDVQQIRTAVADTYPTVRLSKRQQLRRDDSPARMHRVLTSELTDRQRASLEAAFHAGFFEWPRDTTGEAVAESLDISAPTFHYHLREAQRKLFDQLLSTPEPDDSAHG